jgi:hypothetical protein
MMGRFRNWLMSLIAGRKYAYWIADDAAAELGELGSVPGEAGAIMLARAMDCMGATTATITLAGYEITVSALARPHATKGDGG